VGSPAGVLVAICNVDQAKAALPVWKFAKLASSQHGFGLGAGHIARSYRAIFPEDLVRNPFHTLQTVGRNWSTGQIDRRSAFPQMKGDRWRLKFLPNDGREQVLSRVLLRMIEPPLPVDLSLYMSPRGKRFAHEMSHRALLVLLYLFHGNHQRRSVPRKCAQPPRIERLPAAGRVEGGTVQRQLPGQFSIAAREFAEVGYGCGESSEKGI